MKKIISVVLCLVLIAQMAVCVFADNTSGDTVSLTASTNAEIVNNPHVGTAYKLGMDRGDGNVLYFTGNTESATVTYRLETTTDASLAVDVYLEAADGGYRLYFINGGVKTYIRVFHRIDGDPGYGKGSLEFVTSAPSEVYTYDETANTLIYDFDGNNAYYMGTYNTYTSISVSNTYYITGNNAGRVDVSQFPARFYTVEIEDTPNVTEPPATEPPATEPPATEPPATEPPATEPPATEPPATEPPATEIPTEAVPTGLSYSVSNGEVTITDYTGSATELVIPETIDGYPVIGIGDSAFRYCSSLTSVTIPDSVTSIGSYAFRGCSSLTSVTIPGSVTSIGLYAFASCSSLTSIAIGDSVTSIGSYAFYGCTSLTSVTIGDSVTSIGNYAFSGCSSLTGVYISDIAAWCTINFEGYYANPLNYAKNLYLNGNLVKNLVIPDSVTSIGLYAFASCSSLTSIAIGDSVTSIGNYAFYNCDSLTSATIGDSVTSIGSYAFQSCSSLTSVTIGDSVTSIRNDAFWGCSSLIGIWVSDKNINYSNDEYGVLFNKYKTKLIQVPCAISGDYTIPDSVTSIGSYAFRNCSSLTSVTIPDSVTSIGSYAFRGCSSLTSVTIPGSVTSIGLYAFEDCSSLTSVTIGNSIANIGDSVTSIGNYAFSDCDSLTSVIIGNSVTSIGSSAFWDCNSLTSVTIGDSVTSIGNYAFSYCRSLTSIYISDIAAWCGITFANSDANPLGYAKNLYLNGNLVTDLVIPDSVTSIGDCAFYNCDSLTSVTIPDSVTSIGSSAFQSCSSLTSVTIPDSVTSIGVLAFFGCDGLTAVYITDIAAWCGITFGDSIANPLHYAKNLYLNGSLLTDLVIPDSVTSIGSYAFYDFRSLTSVTIGDSVTSIGYAAFQGCSSLTSITIGDSVTSIGNYAFRDCNSLTSVTIGDSVTSIGNYAFNGCSSLTSVTIGDSVTSIGNYAFYKCSSLTSITIPDSVTSIGSYAFEDCSSLTSVTIGDSVTSIGSYAFCSCSSLTSVTIPDSVTSIGNYAFYKCSSLTSVTIPDSVTSIGSYAFEYCNSLTSIYISDIAAWCAINFENTYANPLYYAKNLYLNGSLLTDLVIPDSVTRIGSYAFYGCSSLTSITIPDSVTSIGSYAFRGCSSLTGVYISDISAWCTINFENTYANPLWYVKNLYLKGNLVTDLVIPDSVTRIGSYAFYGCSSLTSITIPDSVTSIGEDAFFGCTSLTHIIYEGTQEQWELVEIGSNNSSLSRAEVFHYGGGEVYWTKNCVNVGLYCSACDDFLTREREDDGTHTFTDDAELACNDCDYIRPIRTISIYQLPARLEYTHCKDTLDVSGGILLLTYSNGISSKMDMTPDMVSGFDNTVLGSQVLTVTVEGCKTSYPVTVVLGEPESLTVDRLPDKLIYISGESLDLTGLSVTAHYANNYTEALSLSDLTVGSVDMRSSGVKAVTVSYDGASASFDIYVHYKGPITVDSSLYPESSHNYASNTDETKVFTYPYAEQLVLTFNSSSYTESNYDFLYVLDGAGNQIGKYSGSLAGKVVTVPGDTVQLRLVSDSSVNKYGYAFTSIVAAVMEYTRQEVSGYAPTLTAPGLTDGVICQCCGTVIEAQQEIPQLEGSVAQWNLSLEDDWKAIFHLQISDVLVPTAQVQILVGEYLQSFPVKELQKTEDGFYLVSVGVAAAQMNDTISVQVINGEDCGQVYTYTVRQYCDTILADSSQSQYHALIKEMLNYGAMAQVYFGYDAENLANDGITGVANADIPETAEEKIVSDEISSLNFYGASLLFRDRIAVRYYFTGDVTGCTFTANGNTYTPVARDGMHYIEIADILPQNLDQQITMALTDANGNTLTVTYGPMNYIVRMNEKGDDALKALVKALYNYHLAAKALTI